MPVEAVAETLLTEELQEIQSLLRRREAHFFQALQFYAGSGVGYQQDDPAYNFWNHGEFTGEDLCEDASAAIKRVLETRFPEIPIEIVATNVRMVNYNRTTKDKQPFKMKKHAWLRIGPEGNQIFIDGVPGQVDPARTGQILTGSLREEEEYLVWDPKNPPINYTEECERHFVQNSTSPRPNGKERLAALFESLTNPIV